MASTSRVCQRIRQRTWRLSSLHTTHTTCCKCNRQPREMESTNLTVVPRVRTRVQKIHKEKNQRWRCALNLLFFFVLLYYWDHIIASKKKEERRRIITGLSRGSLFAGEGIREGWRWTRSEEECWGGSSTAVVCRWAAGNIIHALPYIPKGQKVMLTSACIIHFSRPTLSFSERHHVGNPHLWQVAMLEWR